jgi:hypothetical protein
MVHLIMELRGFLAAAAILGVLTGIAAKRVSGRSRK